MEIVVTARHTEVSGRFRRHLEEKLVKVEQYAPKAQRLEVGVSHELNKRQANSCERVELTLRGKGPVVRAEACAGDPYSALDMATTKLLERLRRAGDRRKVHHGGRHQNASLHTAAIDVPDAGGIPASVLDGAAPDGAAVDGAVLDGAVLDGAVAAHPSTGADDHVHTPAPAASAADAADAVGAVDAVDRPAAEYVLGESPVVIRDKVHVARPMALDDALNEMELVGHDFYLFIDSSTGCPSVVYRRRGWSYGVIRLAGSPEEAEAVSRAVAAAADLSPVPAS